VTVRASVEVWIVRRDSSAFVHVLLLHKLGRESGSHPHPPFWQPVTGGVEPGESHADAAVREVREETGIRLAADSLRVAVSEFEVVVDDELTVRKRVFLAWTTTADVTLDGVEHDDARWTDPVDVVDLLWWSSNRTTWQTVRPLVLTPSA